MRGAVKRERVRERESGWGDERENARRQGEGERGEVGRGWKQR